MIETREGKDTIALTVIAIITTQKGTAQSTEKGRNLDAPAVRGLQSINDASILLATTRRLHDCMSSTQRAIP
jgi:hypothetical protein